MEDNSDTGFTPTRKYRIVTLGKGPYLETHSLCLWVAPPLQVILMQVPTRIQPHVSRYIYEGFLDWIISSTYQPRVDVFQLLPRGQSDKHRVFNFICALQLSVAFTIFIFKLLIVCLCVHLNYYI